MNSLISPSSLVLKVASGKTESDNSATLGSLPGEIKGQKKGAALTSLDNSKQLDICLGDKGLASKQIGIKVAGERRLFENVQDLEKEFESRGFFEESKRLKDCGKGWIFYECRDCGSVGWSKKHCGLRVCPTCAERMKKRLLAKYYKGLKKLPKFYKRRLRLITLTIKNVPDLRMPDFDAITFIKQAFYRLRKRPCLKVKIYGGVYGLETTNTGKGWHLHIHALVSSDYIVDACNEMKRAKNRSEEVEIEKRLCRHCKDKCLRRLWQEETGSTVIDVRKANVIGINEVVGYITKPFASDDAALLVDWWQAMKNRPFLKPFGVFFKMAKIKVYLICPWCGGHFFKVYYGKRVRLFDMRDMKDPPSGVDIEVDGGILFINPDKVVVSLDDKGFENRTLYLQSNLELLSGSYK